MVEVQIGTRHNEVDQPKGDTSHVSSLMRENAEGARPADPFDCDFLRERSRDGSDWIRTNVGRANGFTARPL